jgi:hypothetical protein
MTQYLILHKVRGEPAFDIAEKLQIGDEEGWIIPTSGHRAYPYQMWPIDHNRHPMEGIPPEWPDHYECKGEIVQPKIDISALLRKFAPKVHRRF